MLGYVIVKGAVQPAGVAIGWVATRIDSDLTMGPGWIVVGPWAQLQPWMATVVAPIVQSGEGAWSPAHVTRSLSGVDWSAIQVAAQAGATPAQTLALHGVVMAAAAAAQSAVTP